MIRSESRSVLKSRIMLKSRSIIRSKIRSRIRLSSLSIRRLSFHQSTHVKFSFPMSDIWSYDMYNLQ